VAAKIIVSFTAKATVQYGIPGLGPLQVLPLSVEIITPEEVPAKIFEPIEAKHKVILLLTLVQVTLLLVDRLMPALVAAKTFDPITATEFI
jgi:hypothetical protein